MIGEVTAKAVETAAKAVAETAKETGKAISRQAVDITKRVDITQKAVDVKPDKVDITKRIQPERTKDLKELSREYINDLKTRSPFPETISNSLDTSKLERKSPEEVANKREEFDENKKKLRNEWEKLNNKEWPRYDQDVYSPGGVKIRKVGDYYDAHHIQPLELGGKNEASNITPLDHNKHKEIHAKDSSCKKLVEKVGGQ